METATKENILLVHIKEVTVDANIAVNSLLLQKSSNR